MDLISENNTRKRGIHAEKLYSKVASRANLTPGGAAWLKYALDPFPDEDLPTASFPDENQAKSNVSTVKQGLTLTRPASIGSTTKWDALIWTNGNMKAAETYAENNGAVRLTGSSMRFEGASNAGYYPIQPLTIYAAPSGSPMFPDGAYYPWTETNTDRFTGLNLDPWLTDRCRLLGFGVEVHDVTPELYKGGSITVADVSSDWVMDERLTVVEDQGPPVWTPQPVYLQNAPPATLAAATLLPGSRTWEARDGTYAVGKMCKMKNEYRPTVWGIPCWATSYPASDGGVSVGVAPEPMMSAAAFTLNSLSGYTVYAGNGPTQPVPFDLKCILLTGLDPNASFRINFNALIESIPDLDDERLLVLARPSAPLDMNALELYSEVVRELPAGVPVSWNASGDWWDSVLGALEKFAAPVGNTLGALGVPFASTIGNAVSGAASMGKKLTEEKGKKKQAVVKAGPAKKQGPAKAK